ncbi:MAG: LytTR family DNA-binding domain-containing protein [Emcibacteraceae bacterium]|uniref:LytTR family DNA-binding domain-containing protein n=1 Tax=Pseudemcibacter sp. TaxID=2943293 RepID=UPI003F69CD02|nr:LytTR family DNA-binding domain-containing protein [Emcibacteraceae bacterium]MDG1727601.1 LytTR family DNA-binding domain-containing protein [Emcibacteraceae bacterium]
MLRATMKDIESRLGNKDFARVHRSTIVKRALIESIKPLSIGDKKIHLQGGVDVRVSRRFHENLKLVG